MIKNSEHTRGKKIKMISLTSVVFNCICSKGRTNLSNAELLEYVKQVKWEGALGDLFSTSNLFREKPEEAKRQIYNELYK
ncbi:MAG: hypothetical protein Q7S06_02760 [Nanoarchaeota archaeon]|nr:hypothetical protein [Nanoarchaeota archaeon]